LRAWTCSGNAERHSHVTRFRTIALYESRQIFAPRASVVGSLRFRGVVDFGKEIGMGKVSVLIDSKSCDLKRNREKSSLMEYPGEGQFTYDGILKLSPYYGWNPNNISVITSRSRRPLKIGRRSDWFLKYLTLHALLGEDIDPIDVRQLTEEPPSITDYDHANLVYLLHILGFPINKLCLTKSFRKLFTEFSLELIVEKLRELDILDYDLSHLKLFGVIKDSAVLE
jgi:hypothetical protein